MQKKYTEKKEQYSPSQEYETDHNSHKSKKGLS